MEREKEKGRDRWTWVGGRNRDGQKERKVKGGRSKERKERIGGHGHGEGIGKGGVEREKEKYRVRGSEERRGKWGDEETERKVHGQMERKVKGVDYEIRGKDRRTWAGGRERDRGGWKERKKVQGIIRKGKIGKGREWRERERKEQGTMSRNRERKGMWERKESTWRQAGGRKREGGVGEEKEKYWGTGQEERIGEKESDGEWQESIGGQAEGRRREERGRRDRKESSLLGGWKIERWGIKK
jgi:hypothetical protein